MALYEWTIRSQGATIAGTQGQSGLLPDASIAGRNRLGQASPSRAPGMSIVLFPEMPLLNPCDISTADSDSARLPFISNPACCCRNTIGEILLYQASSGSGFSVTSGSASRGEKPDFLLLTLPGIFGIAHTTSAFCAR